MVKIKENFALAETHLSTSFLSSHHELTTLSVEFFIFRGVRGPFSAVSWKVSCSSELSP